MGHESVDIAADIARFAELGVLDTLLLDCSIGKNIVWASNSLGAKGAGYWAKDEIVAWMITGANAGAVRTRAEKAREERAALTKAHAEVFTPTWVCKQMIDYADSAWWESLHASQQGQLGIGEDGAKGGSKKNATSSATGPWLDKEWQSQHWQEYVASPRLEITCGEAPFLVNRYNADTGEIVPPEQRTGILGRKLALVGQASNNRKKWMKWAAVALQSVYGYELLGSSLLIARINALCSVEEFAFSAGYAPLKRGEYEQFAEIISWNLWQMDGLTDCVPFGTAQDEPPQDRLPGFDDLFATPQETEEATPGRGAALIFDWKNNTALEFRELKQKGTTMKFDYIIGNPPYQEEKEDNGRKPPVYDRFMEGSYPIANVVELITPARFLFNAGQTPKHWNKKMLNDEHLKVIYYNPNGAEVFPNTDIKGGIVITLRNERENYGAIEVFLAFPELDSLLEKVHAANKEGDYLSSVISTQGIYRFTDKVFADFPALSAKLGAGTGNKIVSLATEKLPEVFLDESPKSKKGYVKLLTRIKGERTYRYILSDYIQANDWLNSYNVFVPESNGSGALGEVLTTPLIGEPLIGHTDTFLSIGRFKKKEEAKACLSYVKTRFARALLGTLKVTQHNPANTWVNVPLQDFTSTSDIDWSQSVADVDRQLYKKYGLSKQEIEFIETHVKEMD